MYPNKAKKVKTFFRKNSRKAHIWLKRDWNWWKLLQIRLPKFQLQVLSTSRNNDFFAAIVVVNDNDYADNAAVVTLDLAWNVEVSFRIDWKYS